MRIKNNVLYSVEQSEIINGTFVIPETVTKIGDFAFAESITLTSINIPASVRSVGKWAFRYCVNLVSVILPDSVTSIGNGAFCGCMSLTSVIMPKSIKSIGKWAFYNCTGLTSYDINKSDIIDLAISLLPDYDGLCPCLDKATRLMSKRLHIAISVHSIFPNFKRGIAIEKFDGRKEGYWWPIWDTTSRLRVLEWLRNN